MIESIVLKLTNLKWKEVQTGRPAEVLRIELELDIYQDDDYNNVPNLKAKKTKVAIGWDDCLSLWNKDVGAFVFEVTLLSAKGFSDTWKYY